LVLRNNFFLPDDFPDLRPCDTMFNCFLVTIREGLINGGGMADYLQPRSIADKPNFMARFFFDLSFFCVILVILMNVIFGIIIDTFSALREIKYRNINYIKTTCFMCSIDRYTFDRQGTPFEIHIKEEHNMWKYLFYLVYLKTKDASDYTGLESYVAGLLEEEDVSFYPVNKSMCLDADDEEEDPFQVASMSKFDHLTKELGFLKNTVMDMKSESGSTQATTAEFNNNLMAKLSSMQEQQNAIMTELNNANNI
jgi:inositol 1,4,5-triphosphate receptor type 1